MCDHCSIDRREDSSGSHTFFDHPHKLSLGHLVSRPEVYKFIKNLCKGFVLVYYYICVVVLVLQTCGLLQLKV